MSKNCVSFKSIVFWNNEASMKKSLLFFLLFVYIFLPLSADWISFGGYEGQEPAVNIISQDNNSTTIEFSIPGYYLEKVLINRDMYSSIFLPHTPSHLKKGYPNLPQISRSIIIPNNSHMDYKIIEVEAETITIEPVIPSKGNLTRDINPSTVPYTFDAFYETNDWFPRTDFSLKRSFIMRDFRGLPFTFNPFHYNPYKKEMKVTKRMVVKIYRDGQGRTNVKEKKPTKIAREFRKLYENIFINFNPAGWDTINEHAGRILIITADNYYNNMIPFYQWKLQKGFPTKLVKYSEVGNGSTAIKDYITNEYNNPGVTFVILVGDAEDIPPATGTVGSASGQPADPVYACVEGTDHYPDLFISRFSANTTEDVDNQVNRSIYYEMTPDLGADWYHWGTGIASTEYSGTINPAYDTTRCNWLRHSLLAYSYSLIDQIYDPGANSSMVKSALEEGRGVVNYIGHGSLSGWGTSGFSISDVNNLQNPWELPFIISVACYVGYFPGVTCFCEAWLRAGTPSQPRGAITHWGSSISQTWEPPCFGQEGAVNLLTHDKMNTVGGVFFNGACHMMDVYYGGDYGVEMSQTWHIFGDASLQLRTDTPDSMTVYHDAQIYSGLTTFDVTVFGVEDALCAFFRNDTLYGSAYTNASGFAIITIDPPLPSSGEITLTVTAYNKIPYIVSIPVQAPSGPYISFLKGIIDDTGGNGNGRINPGETIDLTAWAKNIGVETGYGIYGILSDTDPYVSISNDSTWFGNIAAGDSSSGAPSYVFSITNNCPDGHTILFDFAAYDVNDSIWISHFFTTVYAPFLTLTNFVVDPTGNQRLDPGETVDLIVTPENEGSEDAPSVTGYLFENSPYITVQDPNSSFGDIQSGGTASNASNPFIVHAPNSTPIGHTFTFKFEIKTGSFVDTLEFKITVGAKHYLIWDPDPNHTSGPAIDAALQACGYVGDYCTILPTTELDDYLAVFVCVGIFWENYVIEDGSSEATALVNFVNGGGRMYLEGGDVWYADLLSGGYDFGSLFGINPTDDGSDSLETVLGQGEAFTEGISFGYNGENNWIDHISPQSSGFTIFSNSSPQFDCGVANDTLLYKTVGVSFEFGGLTDGSPPSTKEVLVDSIMHFFGIRAEEKPGGVLIIPKVYGLSQSYPNPCNYNAVINYQIPFKGTVSLSLYDVSGRLVEPLMDGVVEPGYHSLRVNMRRYASGVYFYCLVAGGKTFTMKMIVVK